MGHTFAGPGSVGLVLMYLVVTSFIHKAAWRVLHQLIIVVLFCFIVISALTCDRHSLLTCCCCLLKICFLPSSLEDDLVQFFNHDFRV